MRLLYMLGAFTLSMIGSGMIISSQLYRWEKEPGQVIACILCMLLASALFMALTYFLTSKRKRNVQGRNR